MPHDPSHADALSILADEYLIAGDTVNLGALLAAFPPGSRENPWWQLLVADVAQRQGDADGCLDHLAPLLSHPDAAIRARALIIRVSVSARQGRVTEAERDLAEAGTCLAPADVRGLGLLWLTRGSLAILRWDVAASEAALAEAMAIFQRAGHAVGEAKACIYLSISRGNRGDLTATPLIDRAETLYRQAGWTQPVLLTFLRAQVAYLQGDFARAAALYTEAAAIAATLQDEPLVRRAHALHADALLAMGDLATAGQAYERSLAEAETSGFTFVGLIALLGLAEVACRQGDPDGARRWLDHFEATQPLDADHPLHLRWQTIRIRVALQAGQPDAAASALDVLEGALAGQDQPFFAAMALSLRGKLAALKGATAAAATAVAACTELCRRMGYDFLKQYDDPAPVPGAPPAITVSCFGHFDVRHDGRSLFPDTWKGRQVMLLLVALILAPDGLSREALEAQLYPKQRTSRTAISVLVTRLRKAIAAAGPVWESIGGLVVSQQGRYRLNPALTVHADLTLFAAAWHEAQQATTDDQRLTAYRRLVGLYTGPLFAAYHDADWVLVAHQRTRHQWQEAHRWLQATLSARGDLAGALALVDAQLALDPLDEAVHRRKIDILLASGRKRDARQQYDAMAHVLSHRLGRFPSEESRRLLPRLTEL